MPEKTPPGDTDLRAEIAELKAQLAAKQAREDSLEKTVNALAAGRQQATPEQPQNYTPNYIPPEVRQRLKARLGPNWQDADIEQHWQTIGTFLSELGQPLVNGLGSLADRVDHVDVRLRRKDFAEEPDFANEVEEEYQTRLRRGEPRSRWDLAEMVRARPKWRDKDVERELAKKLETERGRSTVQTAATTEGAVSGGQVKSGAPLLQSGRELSPDEFKSLSLEDKESYLEGKVF